MSLFENKIYLKFPIKYFIGLLFFISIYYIFLNLFGYSSVVFLSVISLFLIIPFFNIKYDFYSISSISILFLTIFDNEVITWSSYNIRTWYIIIILIIICRMILFFTKRKIRIKFNVYLILLLYFLLISFVHFIFDDMIAKLYNIKYWLFTIGFVSSFYWVSVRARLSKNDLLFLWYYFIIFSTLWGILQYSGNILGFAGINLQHDWFNISPSGFFSERTWYGQYCAIGIVLTSYFLAKTNFKRYYIFIPIFLFGFIISYSRSAFIPIIAYFLSSIIVFLVNSKIKKSMFINILIYSILTVCVILVLNKLEILNIIGFFNKFSNSDIGIQGRYEAFYLYYNNLIMNPIDYLVGNGFYWDRTHSSSIGVAIGAKSANLLFMIFHIFGLFGLIFAIILILILLLRIINNIISDNSFESKLSLTMYLTFIGLTFFVPAHMYPPTLVILFFSMYLSSKKEN